MILGSIIVLEGNLRNMRGIILFFRIVELDRDRLFIVLFMEFFLKIIFKRIVVNN